MHYLILQLFAILFSDWTCGGQWNRMFQYLSHLIMACRHGNIELTVAFNGALEPQKFSEWAKKQLKNKSKANLVLQHLQNKGTPPPKVWWIAPVCLITSLRMALRYCNVPVVSIFVFLNVIILLIAACSSGSDNNI